MHVEMFGMGRWIKDMETVSLASTNGVKAYVYGHSRCQEYAHVKGPGVAVVNTVSNADNYAWWATSQYFYQRWGKLPSKRGLRLRSDDSSDPDDGIDMVDLDDIQDDSTYIQAPPNPGDECTLVTNTNSNVTAVSCTSQGAVPF